MLTQGDRKELLKIELGLLQATLDKYDDLMFRSRNWFVTLWFGTVGAAFTLNKPVLFLFGGLLALIYWFLEGLMRHQYWYKYVLRYRTLRSWLNDPSKSIDDLSVYDLTNKEMRSAETGRPSLKRCFLKLEPTLVYLVIGGCALALWLAVHWQWLSL